MILTRREFLKLGGTAVMSLSFGQYAIAGNVRIPVLMYHDISHQGTDVETVTPPSFAAQMELLYDSGYRAIAFNEIKSLDEQSARLAVIITFDDGYISFMDYAFPLLTEYGFKATVNVVGEYAGSFVSGNDPRLSWDECRLLAQSRNVEIGCHTFGLHTWYGRMSRPNAVVAFNEKLVQDLYVFQNVMVKELGHPASVLAWPYGMHDMNSVTVARQAGFRYILNSENGYYAIDGDQYDIPRLTIATDTTLPSFRERVEMRR